MKYPWLFVGAKVVCVDAGPSLCGNWDAPELTLGTVYTVAEVALSPRKNIVHIAIEEFASCRNVDGDTWMYGARRFAPVLPDTTDVVESIKQKLRDAVKQPERVRV